MIRHFFIISGIFLLIFMISCKTEEKIIPNYQQKPLKSFSKYELPKEYDHLIGIGGFLYLEDIPVDQENTNSSAEGFSQTLGKNISSIPGELDINFSSFLLSVDELSSESIEYMRIESIDLEIPSKFGKGDLKFIKEAKVYLVDPKHEKEKTILVLDYQKSSNNKSCIKSSGEDNCDWTTLRLKFKSINLLDYIKISEVSHKDSSGKKSSFDFQDLELKFDFKLDTPSGIKFKISPRIKFVVGVYIPR